MLTLQLFASKTINIISIQTKLKIQSTTATLKIKSVKITGSKYSRNPGEVLEGN